MSARRLFLKTGVVGAGLLALGGTALFLTRNPVQERETVLRGVIPGVLAGALAANGPERSAGIEKALKATLVAINGLPPSAQTEIEQLFALLASAPGRWLAGLSTDWANASDTQLTEFLQSWRTHKIALFQVSYHALHDLIAAPWYGDASNWASIGYPGPIKL
jgi:hypothetical protein